MKFMGQIFYHITQPFEVQEKIWFRCTLSTEFSISVEKCTDVYVVASACNCTLDRQIARIKDRCYERLHMFSSAKSWGFIRSSSALFFVFSTLRTGLLNCLNARSRGLTFRHRASCIQGQAFRYYPENAFYIFNQQIYSII